MRDWNSSLLEWARVLPIAMAGWILAGMLCHAPVTSANDASRWDTVWSLTHGRGYVIDEAPFSTIDKVRRGDHFYSSKPPLLPTLVAGMVYVILKLTPLSFPADQKAVIWPVLIVINLVPMVAMVHLYSRLLRSSGFKAGTIAFCTFVACFGTYLTAYSITLNNHTVAAYSTFFGIYCLVKIRYCFRKKWTYFTACGLFSAWAGVNELPAILFLVSAFLVLLRVDPPKTVMFFVPPAVGILVLHFYATWLSTGGLGPNYLHFGGPIYHYDGSYWNHPRGIDAADEGKLVYLINMLIGHHGIFSLSPILLFGAVGLCTTRQYCGIHQMGLVLSYCLIIFYGLSTHNYGGSCQGLRWFIWVIPFFLLAMPGSVEKHLESLCFKVLAGGALAISVGSVMYGLVVGGPWGSSWLHVLMRGAHWIDY